MEAETPQKKSSSGFGPGPALAKARESLGLTHEEVASMTATTRETVTRTLGRFRKEKIISTHGVVLTVLQPRVLERLCAC